MTETTKQGLSILLSAVVLGAIGESLLRAPVPGLNVFLWTGLIVSAPVTVARVLRMPLVGEGRWMLIPALLLAGGFLWRDSPLLLVLDMGAMAVCLALSAAFSKQGQLRGRSLAGYVVGGLTAGLQTLGGLVPVVFGDIHWNEIPRGRWSAQAAAVARGLLIAVPLLLVFGGLFIAADAVFADLAAGLFRVRLDELFLRLVGTGFWAWLAAGFLRSTLQAKPADPAPVGRPVSVSLGAVETGVILALLNALFLAFVLVQFRYFFGGAALVEASTTLTFADYARRGFFELLWVSALVLPLLLVGHWLIAAEQPGAARLFRWLAGALVTQLFVIMASAVQRMLLYQREFGLTELRLYSTAFMGWLAILFVWFLATVLRDRRDRFAFGALLSGLAMLGALHVLNPDGFIARVNLSRAGAGRPFDAAYVASLSADAVPVLVEALPQMQPAERNAVLSQLQERWRPFEQHDWRSWNWGRTRALHAIQEALP